MGNSQSPAGDARYLRACRAFSKQELEELRSLFQSLAAQSQSDGMFISLSVFVVYFVIPSPLGGRVFELPTQKRGRMACSLSRILSLPRPHMRKEHGMKLRNLSTNCVM